MAANEAAAAAVPDAETQFHLGVKLVQEGFAEQAKVLAYWRDLSSAQKEQLVAADKELDMLRERNSKLERQAREHEQQHALIVKRLAEAEAELASLRSFRSNISNMVAGAASPAATQAGPGGGGGSLGTSIDPSGASVDERVSQLQHMLFAGVSPSSAATNLSAGEAHLAKQSAADAAAVTAGPSTRFDLQAMQQQPARAVRARQQQPPHSQDADGDMDSQAQAFYRSVKRVLPPQDFRRFASEVKRLNSGVQSVEETLERGRAIFGHHRPFLYQQFEQLLRQAEDEASAA